MTDPTSPQPPHPDERIGAWLDGELTERQAEAFLAELEADPDLAARLEAIREVRERLAGSGASEVSDGFTAGVQQAVAAEAGASPPSGATGGGGPAGTGPEEAVSAAETTSLDDARARRERRRRRLVAAGSVAAAVIALAVLTPLLGTLTPQSEEAADLDVAEESFDSDDDAPAPAAPEAPEALEGADDAGDGVADEERAESGERRITATSVGEVPLVIDEQRVFNSPSTLLEHATDRPEAVELLGAPPGQAEELTERTADALRRAPTLDDGTRPGACAGHLLDAIDGPAVFARVERLVLDGEPFTAHLVVSGQPGGPLETITLHVLDPDASCASRLTERLE